MRRAWYLRKIDRPSLPRGRMCYNTFMENEYTEITWDLTIPLEDGVRHWLKRCVPFPDGFARTALISEGEDAVTVIATNIVDCAWSRAVYLERHYVDNFGALQQPLVVHRVTGRIMSPNPEEVLYIAHICPLLPEPYALTPENMQMEETTPLGLAALQRFATWGENAVVVGVSQADAFDARRFYPEALYCEDTMAYRLLKRH